MNKLISRLKCIENNLDRIRGKNKNGPRTIDLDVVIWNGDVVDKDVYERDFLRNSIKQICSELEI